MVERSVHIRKVDGSNPSRSTQKMNILFLTRRFYPSIGGVEKHVLEISKELIKRGHEVTVITERSASLKLRGASNYHSGDQSDTYSINSNKAVKSIRTDNSELEKIKVLRLNFGKESSFKKFRIWLRLLRHAGTIKQFNVIHCHDVFFWYLPFRFLFPSKKVFTTFHGYETKFPPSTKARLVRKISEKLSYGNICVGEYIKRWDGTKPDYVTYGGVSEDRRQKTDDRNRRTEDRRQRSLKILLVGRLEEDNGAKIYLEALEKLRKQGITYKLTVCGDGQFKKRFEKYGDMVGFTSDLNKYIDRSYFIFASSYLSILEAIFRGKNVFAVFQNDLKKDYLTLSPFKKYISIAGDVSSLVKNVSSVRNKPFITYNNLKLAQDWSKGQTWGKVASIYLKLWKL